MQQTQSPTNTSNLARDLASLLNRYSAENGSNTPDFLLAEYLLQGLALLNKTVQARAKWYGRMDAPGQSPAATDSAALIVLAELGVADPSTDLLRAQLMLEHAKNAHDLAVKLGVAGKVAAFTVAEEAAAAGRNLLLAGTPMGASFADSGILASMARDAAKEVGPATMVTVDADTIDSRYVQYLLRCPDPKPPGGDYRHGVAVVKAVWANGKQHVFPRPILVAAGEGLKDPRQPFDYRDLVQALHAAGLVTNDRIAVDSVA